LLSFGVIAFANGGTSANSDTIMHDAITGKFVALEDENSKIKVDLGTAIETYPLADSIWVLRDHQKATLENLKLGDKLEMVWNSSNQVAYIKAYSEEYLKAEAVKVSAASITASPTPCYYDQIRPAATQKANKSIIK
jgi:hypothetical protein